MLLLLLLLLLLGPAELGEGGGGGAGDAATGTPSVGAERSGAGPAAVPGPARRRGAALRLFHAPPHPRLRPGSPPASSFLHSFGFFSPVSSFRPSGLLAFWPYRPRTAVPDFDQVCHQLPLFSILLVSFLPFRPSGLLAFWPSGLTVREQPSATSTRFATSFLFSPFFGFFSPVSSFRPFGLLAFWPYRPRTAVRDFDQVSSSFAFNNHVISIHTHVSIDLSRGNVGRQRWRTTIKYRYKDACFYRYINSTVPSTTNYQVCDAQTRASIDKCSLDCVPSTTKEISIHLHVYIDI